MIGRLGSALNRFARRWVPDPFVLALGLTVVVFVVGVVYLAWSAPALPSADQGGGEGIFWTVTGGWAAGFSSKGGLAFALQMCLVLVSGHAIALSPPVQRQIRALAALPRSAAGASMLVAAVACIAALVHWGLGAITGALLAREIGRHATARGLRVHYPLLGAAAYAGMAVWHGGLSGSAPLKVAESGNFAEGAIGIVPMGDTVFSLLNIVITGVMVLLVVALFRVLTPRDAEEFVAPDPTQIPPLPERSASAGVGLVAWIQESRYVGAGVGACGLTWTIAALILDKLSFDINSVNMLFVFLGITLQGGLRSYVDAITDGARSAGAIVLQFPFYFGILGIMKAAGLVTWISEGLVMLSTQSTFPVVAFLSAGLLNLFVPSGGGQWGVQGPILLEAGAKLGVEPSTTIMAFSYGDAWTNMLQPFWALPLLGIMGLRARDIIGYTATVFLLMGVAVPVLLILLG